MNDEPTFLIDFDGAAPGSRIRDIAYACWAWVPLSADGPPPREQARRLRLIGEAYGLADFRELVAQIKARQEQEAQDHLKGGRQGPAEWVKSCREWVGLHEELLVRG